MNKSCRNIAILGSTGSIGRSALEVIAASNGRLRAIALSANNRLAELEEQSHSFHPRWLVASNLEAAGAYDWSTTPDECELIWREGGLEQVVRAEEVDIVLIAIVGSAGLAATWAAVDAGKQIALANKESLVTAGPLVMEHAKKRGVSIIPVDSEHSAIFQALASGRREEVARIILTASGGPFRNRTLGQLAEVTVEDALAHPTWDMGAKITVDSATMMNKALEIIEARWLFDLSPDQIDVVIHPQSIVHSMVEFVDGSVVAQLSPPDMRLPIQYALDYPDRHSGPATRIDWSSRLAFQFEPPDPDRFPALKLGYDAARRGGTAGAVLNAANEAAVAAFLGGTLRFDEIIPACQDVLMYHTENDIACQDDLTEVIPARQDNSEAHTFNANPTLDELIRLDRWAREEIDHWVCTSSQ